MTHAWWCIGDGACEGVHQLVLIVHVGEAEVGDFNVVLFVEQQVFKFEVAMNNAFPVAVREGSDNLHW